MTHVQVDLQVGEGFERELHLQVLGGIGGGGGSDAVGAEQPAVVVTLLQIAVADETEGKVETRCHHIARTLTEGIAHIGDEAGQRHRILAAVGDAHVAHHHQGTGQILGGAVPPEFLQRLLGSDRDLHLHTVAVLHENLVLIHHLILQVVGLAIGSLGGHNQTFALLVVGYGDGGIGLESHLFLEAVLLLGQRLLFEFLGFLVGIRGGSTLLFVERILVIHPTLGILTILTVLGILAVARVLGVLRILLVALVEVGSGLLLESLVGLLQEGDMVVERLHVPGAVDGEVAVGGDGVAERSTVFKFGATHPAVVGCIGDIGIEPVEDRQFVERQFVGGRERLLVVEGCTEVLDAVPYRVFPDVVVIGIEVFVDRAVGLDDFGMGGRLEVGMQVLGEVPAQGELTVPEELLTVGEGQLGVFEALQVTLLQLIVVAQQFAVEGDILGQVVEAYRLGEVEPLALALEFLEGFVGLVDGRIAVVERTAPLVFGLIDGGLARGLAMGVAVAESEVGGVVGHGVTLGLDAHTHVGEGEVGVGHLGDGYRLDGVLLMLVGGTLQGIIEFHVTVERVILGAGLRLRDGVIERHRHLRLVGEELAEVETGGEAVGLVVVGGALGQSFLQSAESFGHHLTRKVDAAEVGELHVEGSRRCPSTLVVELEQAQFVHPDLT